jgi:hypothetical protein
MPRQGTTRDEHGVGLANIAQGQYNPSSWAGDEVVQTLVPCA